MTYYNTFSLLIIQSDLLNAEKLRAKVDEKWRRHLELKWTFLTKHVKMSKGHNKKTNLWENEIPCHSDCVGRLNCSLSINFLCLDRLCSCPELFFCVVYRRLIRRANLLNNVYNIKQKTVPGKNISDANTQY